MNAIAHRDYTSNGSVQVMVFRNRVEIWNPGKLPNQLSLDDLKRTHESFPANPVIAEAMFYAGYIERLGTGIPDMIQHCLDSGLPEPEFIQEAAFRTILWRKTNATEQPIEQPTEQLAGEVAGEVTREVERVLLIMNREMKRAEMQVLLQLKHDDFFRTNYLLPALHAGYLKMTEPDSPTSPNQRYRLTTKGMALKKDLENKIRTTILTPHDTPYDAPHDTPYVTPYELDQQLILVLSGEMNRPDLQKKLGIKDTKHFRNSYLKPALKKGWIEMTIPDKPKSKNQKYRLTEKGKLLKKKLKEKK
ncbi:MAG: hypothetical protein HUU54_04020 [Ignavibacteriaceae bacterium]|nr:hypothetical protein [Ignavibacteriaceae bacterium]